MEGDVVTQSTEATFQGGPSQIEQQLAAQRDRRQSKSFVDPYEMKKLQAQQEAADEAAAAGGSPAAASTAGAGAASATSGSGFLDHTAHSFPYDDIKGKKVANIDPMNREMYLQEADFFKHMGCTKAEWTDVKKWKKDQKKKDAGLF